MLTCRQKIGRKGMTLIEVLLSIFIAAVVLVGVIEAMLYLTALSSSSKNRALVFQDMQMTMERISGTQLSSLPTTFPAGAVPAAFVANVLRGYKIPTESVTIAYPNGTVGNPLEVVITGQWTERGGARSVSIRTFRRG